MDRRRILLPALLGAALALGCRTAPPPPEAREIGGPCMASYYYFQARAKTVLKDWVDRVLTGKWTELVPLFPPAAQEKARADLEAATAEQKAKLQETAHKLAEAMRATPPWFVHVKASLAEPAHYEWYFCDREPQGDVREGPCTFSVIAVDGDWYVLEVRDEPDSD
jgi:hypothetical protein